MKKQGTPGLDSFTMPGTKAVANAGVIQKQGSRNIFGAGLPVGI